MSCPIQRFLYCFTVPTLSLLATYIIYTYIYSQVTTRITPHDKDRILSKEFWMHQIQWRSGSNGFVIWWFTQIKVERLRNLSPLHELFSAVFWQCIHFHYISFCCILIDSLLLLAFHYGICKSFITTERGNFFRFKEKRNRTHGLKAVEEKQPQQITFTTTFPIKKEVINPYTGQPCSSSKDKRQYACFSQITLQILFHCIQLHDLGEKPQNTRVQPLAIDFAWHRNKSNEGHLKRYTGRRSPTVFPVHMNKT